jgi:hypothetical protein
MTVDKIEDFKKEEPEKNENEGFIWTSLKDTKDVYLFKERLEYFFDDYVNENQSTMVIILNKVIYISLIEDFLRMSKYRLDKKIEKDVDIHYYITKVKNENSKV